MTAAAEQGERCVRVVEAPKFHASSPWWLKLAWPVVEEDDGATVDELVEDMREVLSFASTQLLRHYLKELVDRGHLRMVRPYARAPKLVHEDSKPVLRVVNTCEVCGLERDDEDHCFSCAEDIPRSSDPRWPLWVAHLAAHPELRPEATGPRRRGGVTRKAIGGKWSAQKVLNVDAWAENKRDDAPPTIDRFAARRHHVEMD